MGDLISRQQASKEMYDLCDYINCESLHIDVIVDTLENLPPAEPEIAENLYLCKCYITDKDGLQHEVIHTGDIRRVTGWEI